ncbi:MAG: hypothetical protein KGI60_04930, partial [Patescibacteria group bacterium]|nr:hypothetical protein [Patescibacteria group bacterium]
MKGLQLRSLSGELEKVPEEFAEKPVQTIPDIEAKFGKRITYRGEGCEKRSKILKNYHDFPLGAFVNFSFDELCKFWHSTICSMNESVDVLFTKNARYEIVRKIGSSMWRWGCRKGTWNEVVDAYNGISNFSLDLGPDFEIRLDYTTYYNECGRAKFSRIFLDGVFAYLVYYRGEHVMTIGFSIAEGRKLL